MAVPGANPRGPFTFIDWVIRWNNRVTGYVIVLVTDRYPSFHLAA